MREGRGRRWRNIVYLINITHGFWLGITKTFVVVEPCVRSKERIKRKAKSRKINHKADFHIVPPLEHDRESLFKTRSTSSSNMFGSKFYTCP